MTLVQGQVLNNRYRIVKLLGQGGFGAVYKAWDITLNRPCAVKENFETSPEAQRQFLREAQILANLSHPGLPRVTDYFALPGQGQYLVMDYVEGEDLDEIRARAGGAPTEVQALDWIGQVCDALAYLHSRTPPVIHRDIKPANIKVTPEGKAMLVDFGIAKVYDPQAKTTLGARAFTPGYSPLEQYGRGITDARSDMYALGATLYTLLTGVEPPESTQRAVRDPLVSPRQLNPDISTVVEAVLLKALLIDPEHRFQTAAEFKLALPLVGAILAQHPDAQQQAVVTTPAQAPATPPRAMQGIAAGKGRGRGRKGIPWKRLGLAAGVMVILVVLIGLGGIAIKEVSSSHLMQTMPAQASQTAAFQVSRMDGMLLVYIPSGTFQMGSNDGESDEQPVHSVTLDAFWMDQTEVTNGMYAGCVAAGACSLPHNSDSYSRSSYYGNPEYDNYPVIWVDWYQAEAYCTWAGRQLPSEAQWEYVTRGGLDGATYPWGEGIDCTMANYWACEGDTSTVGSYLANGYGLYDMAGNVVEWVADRYDTDYYSSSPTENPEGPVNGGYRVLRGGAWISNGNGLRSALRLRNLPDYTDNYIGFRCARSP